VSNEVVMKREWLLPLDIKLSLLLEWDVDFTPCSDIPVLT